MAVPVELTTAPDFVQVRLALLRHLGGALEAIVFTRIQYRTADDSRAWFEHNGRRWWTVTIPELADEMGATTKQIRRVLDILTTRGALVRAQLQQTGPYDRRYSYSPAITEVPSGAHRVPSGADVEVPSRANVDLPSGTLLSSVKNKEERERSAEAPSPYCSTHPQGTEDNCGPCGTARRRSERWHGAAVSQSAPVLRLADIAMCLEHPDYPIERDGTCAKCERLRDDTRGAA